MPQSSQITKVYIFYFFLLNKELSADTRKIGFNWFIKYHFKNVFKIPQSTYAVLDRRVKL